MNIFPIFSLLLGTIFGIVLYRVIPSGVIKDNELGVSEKISSFTVPLRVTINMDSTAIMQGVAVVFIAQASGITL